VSRASQDVAAISPGRVGRVDDSDVRDHGPKDQATSDLVSLGEAARLLGVSEGTLRRWADEGSVAVFTTPGGHRRFSRTTLGALLPADRVHRPSLLPPGGSPDRIVRAYRPPDSASHVGPAWLDYLSPEQRQVFRDNGRSIVNALVAHLDAQDDDTRTARLQEACQLAADHGRRVQALGASIPDAVKTFLEYRSPFVNELAVVARQRGLDTREAMELLMEADSAMDRLLTSMMAGHALASESAGSIGD
jgi:excisionase family DNA binding protein